LNEPQSTFTADGPNKVIEKEEWDGKNALHIYEIDGDLLTMARTCQTLKRLRLTHSFYLQTIELGDVRCIRKFQRI